LASDQWLANVDRWSAIGDQWLARPRHLLTDHQSRAADYLPLATCSPATDHGSLAASYQPAVTDHRPLATSHRALSTDKGPGITASPTNSARIFRRQCPGRRRCSIRWLSRHPQESCRKYRKGNGAAFREYAGCNDCANSVSNRHPRDESHIVGSGSRSYEVPTLSATDTSAMSARQLVRRKQERGTSSPVVMVT